MPKEFPFKIGADPEFNIINQDKQIHAKHFIQEVLKDNRNLAKEELGFRLENAGSIGWDGADSTAEIRPDPANQPAKIVDNLEKLLKLTIEKIKILDFSTKQTWTSVGGHIHLEINKKYKSETANKIQRTLSAFYIPLLLGENKIDIKRREKESGYGRLDDYRIQKINDNPYLATFEYRTPSAEWLTTPKIAIATLAYMATIFNEITNHPKKIGQYKNILFNDFDTGKALKELAINDYATIAKKTVLTIRQAIKNFEYYPEYKEEIEYILNPKKVLKDKEKVNYNILQGWDLEEKKIPTKRELLSFKKVREIAQEINLEDFKNIITIQYNEDDYVDTFVRELRNRIIAFNWKTKKKYYFFGMRKGIKNYIALNRNYGIVYHGEQIKTQLDIASINNLFHRMAQKFQFPNHLNRLTTKEADKELQDYIIIGIPYIDRINGNHKKFIEFIYNIEKNKLPATIDRKEFEKGLPPGNKEDSKLYKIIQKNNNENTVDDSIYRIPLSTIGSARGRCDNCGEFPDSCLCDCCENCSRRTDDLCEHGYCSHCECEDCNS